MSIEVLPCSKSYSGKFAVTLPAMSLQHKKIYAVVGANGSGKSTFARLLSGVFRPDNGTPVLRGKVSVGYLAQQNYAFRMSVLQNICLGGMRRECAMKLMESMQIRHLADKSAKQLSGGETARMVLCRLLIRPFELLVLDEPTAAMDVEATILAERAILQYRQEQHAAIVWITHSMQQARRIADEILFFSHGELKEQGDAEKLLVHPSTAAFRQFLEFSGR